MGCLLGLAVGDALGAPVEFCEPGTFLEIRDYTSGGAWNLPAGYWTDDTSMALALADSMLQCHDLVEADVMAKFGAWMQWGTYSSTGVCFDIGNTTRVNISRYLLSGIYQPASSENASASNGSIMRLAPIMTAWWHRADVHELAARQSMITHGNEACVACCRELALLCSQAIAGVDVVTELRTFAQQQTQVVSTSAAVDTLIAAKWAVGSSNNFSEAVLRAVNLGGDADTVAAVAGQIAGSIWGMSGIPSHWISNLYDSQRLANLAEALYNLGQSHS